MVDFSCHLAMTVMTIALYWGVNPNALRKAEIVCNFGLSDCNRVKYNRPTGSDSSFESEFDCRLERSRFDPSVG